MLKKLLRRNFPNTPKLRDVVETFPEGKYILFDTLAPFANGLNKWDGVLSAIDQEDIPFDEVAGEKVITAPTAVALSQYLISKGFIFTPAKVHALSGNDILDLEQHADSEQLELVLDSELRTSTYLNQRGVRPFEKEGVNLDLYLRGFLPVDQRHTFTEDTKQEILNDLGHHLINPIEIEGENYISVGDANMGLVSALFNGIGWFGSSAYISKRTKLPENFKTKEYSISEITPHLEHEPLAINNSLELDDSNSDNVEIKLGELVEESSITSSNSIDIVSEENKVTIEEFDLVEGKTQLVKKKVEQPLQETNTHDLSQSLESVIGTDVSLASEVIEASMLISKIPEGLDHLYVNLRDVCDNIQTIRGSDLITDGRNPRLKPGYRPSGVTFKDVGDETFISIPDLRTVVTEAKSKRAILRTVDELSAKTLDSWSSNVEIPKDLTLDDLISQKTSSDVKEFLAENELRLFTEQRAYELNGQVFERYLPKALQTPLEYFRLKKIIEAKDPQFGKRIAKLGVKNYVSSADANLVSRILADCEDLTVINPKIPRGLKSKSAPANINKKKTSRVSILDEFKTFSDEQVLQYLQENGLTPYADGFYDMKLEVEARFIEPEQRSDGKYQMRVYANFRNALEQIRGDANEGIEKVGQTRYVNNSLANLLLAVAHKKELTDFGVDLSKPKTLAELIESNSVSKTTVSSAGARRGRVSALDGLKDLDDDQVLQYLQENGLTPYADGFYDMKQEVEARFIEPEQRSDGKYQMRVYAGFRTAVFKLRDDFSKCVKVVGKTRYLNGTGANLMLAIAHKKKWVDFGVELFEPKTLEDLVALRANSSKPSDEPASKEKVFEEFIDVPTFEKGDYSIDYLWTRLSKGDSTIEKQEDVLSEIQDLIEYLESKYGDKIPHDELQALCEVLMSEHGCKWNSIYDPKVVAIGEVPTVRPGVYDLDSILELIENDSGTRCSNDGRVARPLKKYLSNLGVDESALSVKNTYELLRFASDSGLKWKGSYPLSNASLLALTKKKPTSTIVQSPRVDVNLSGSYLVNELVDLLVDGEGNLASKSENYDLIKSRISHMKHQENSDGISRTQLSSFISFALGKGFKLDHLVEGLDVDSKYVVNFESSDSVGEIVSKPSLAFNPKMSYLERLGVSNAPEGSVYFIDDVLNIISTSYTIKGGMELNQVDLTDECAWNKFAKASGYELEYIEKRGVKVMTPEQVTLLLETAKSTMCSISSLVQLTHLDDKGLVEKIADKFKDPFKKDWVKYDSWQDAIRAPDGSKYNSGEFQAALEWEKENVHDIRNIQRDRFGYVHKRELLKVQKMLFGLGFYFEGDVETVSQSDYAAIKISKKRK